jgi:hypothetical protein
MTLIEGLSIVLAIVSLVITVVGFFASLKFYRDGVELQKSANDALVKLEEKTQAIQTQVGGMFDKTLEAAIGRRYELSESFKELNEQLEKAKVKIIDEAVKQVGDASEKERTRLLEQMVNSQLELIRAKVDMTKESLKDVALTFLDDPSIPTEDKIIGLLSVENRPMSFEEILSRLPNVSQIRLSHVLHDMTKAGDVKELKSPDRPSPLYERK